MPRITVLYFDGCPNWQDADENIRTAVADRSDIRVTYQRVETPEQAEQIGFVGSPTVLIDGVDPFAEPGRPVGLACRIYATAAGPAGSPTVDQIVHALAAAERPAGKEAAGSAGSLSGKKNPVEET